MKRIWSPWRSKFIETHQDRDRSRSPFGLAWDQPENDRQNLLLHRGDLAFIILNLYPYNAGHTLVLPVRETGDFLELSSEERGELIDLVELSVAILKEALSPDGFNIGMNLGKAAGAAIEEHLHMHVVPRWNGDTNFMPTLSETRVVSQELLDIYDKMIVVKDRMLKENS